MAHRAPDAPGTLTVSPFYALPDDLNDEEQAAVEAFLSEAESRARERAGLWVAVRRAFRKHRKEGHSREAALSLVIDQDRLPVTARTARRIVHNDGAWAVPG